MADSVDTKKTALYAAHKALNAKMVPFGGWMMPVSYSTVLTEHKAVREACGVFDVSHMGEVFVRGKNAEAFLQKLTINDVTRLKDGSGQYTAILNEKGGMIDDLIVYRLKADEFLICVNASNADKDFAWIKKNADKATGVTVENASSQWSQLAVQGPTSPLAMKALLEPSEAALLEKLEYMQIAPVNLGGKQAYLARTGYTGEHGYELYLPNEAAEGAWNKLVASAPKSGLQPIGLGARDTLRLEACYLLYGNDMNDDVTPLEAGISWAVRMDAGDFIGKEALLKQKEHGVPRQSFGFTMTADGIPRHDMPVFKKGGTTAIGTITSGSVLPTVGGAGGMALLDTKAVKLGDEIEVDIRGKRKPAVLVKKPLYKAKVKS